MTEALGEGSSRTNLSNLGIAMVEELDELQSVSQCRGMSIKILTNLLKLGRHSKLLVTDEDWEAKLTLVKHRN